MRIKAYVHASKESMWDLGEENGLKGKALDKFRYALYEIEVIMEVNEETGEYEIISFKET